MTNTGSDKRKARRRPILTTFSFSVVIPKKGVHRLEALDISEEGIGFQLDIEGESTTDFSAKIGDSVDVRFYMNSSLYLPVKIQIARIENLAAGRQVGAVFLEKNAPPYKAFLSLLQFLDGVVDVLKIDSAQ